MESIPSARDMKAAMQWELRETDAQKASDLSRALDIPFLLSQLLVSRGVDSPERAKQFLYGGKETLGLSDIPGTEKICGRIMRAVENKEGILVFGDYDADGVCATSLFVLALKKLKASVNYYIPHRLKEGYGLNGSAIVGAAKKGFTLLITFDCGITSVEEITLAKALGMDVIVVDHHLPGETLPADAYGILHPRVVPDEERGCVLRRENGAPPSYQHLCATGLSFALSLALLGDDAHEFSDIAALGTVGDLVPLLDDNRILVREGILRLQSTQNIGILSLLKVCGLAKTAELRSDFHLPFILIPRINAAGRMWSPQFAVELLISGDAARAEKISKKLNEKNKERQNLQERTYGEAERLIETQRDMEKERVIVLAKRGWHPGIVGIVASKLVDTYARPAVLLCIPDGPSFAKGSARSIQGFHMHHALTECSDFLVRYGGHSLAAGLTLAEENISLLRERLCEMAAVILSKEDISPKLVVDAELTEKDVGEETFKSLNLLSPFGAGNRAPVFYMKQVRLTDRKTVARGQHLQFKVKKNDAVFAAVWFRNGKENAQLSDRLYDVAFTLGEDTFNGKSSIQLFIKDVRES